ncbi:GumC family protein [Poseidonocella sedimentorum]|uniref:Polysaccharide chain length determinant protein, PEP-CTERM locus subfamily n=1 Tax=Poseidonocella sedimentorum TaxID=871652 RepID=A0A1I6ENI0_9RHOB|nr:hypothetical protein [Poseidonocella sedimentorum]SFR19289.1 polysaccharide chain length determinant protein, PEP-CTERM locus subfamily [Poseidonocella sedimentorum]
MIPDLRFYFRLLVRRSPAMAALFLLASCIGLLVAVRQPTTYTTSATLLVEAQQIPDSMVRSTIDTNATEQLEVIQQRLMTRTNLLDVARAGNVFPNQSEMSPDEVVSQMQSRTFIRRSSGRDRATLMTLGFRGDSPRQVAAVVNQYVTIVLEANSSFRAERAENTLDFFEQEVSNFSAELNNRSEQIVSFKNQNADALPENLNFRLERQSFLQERLARAERDLDALTAQRANTIRLFENSGLVSANAAPDSPEEAQLRALRNDLRRALSIYSEQNPRVVLLRNQINALAAQIQAQDAEAEAEAPEDAPGESPPAPATPLDISLAEIDTRMDTLRAEITTINEELTELQGSIERTPAIRIALEAMERDQQNTRNLYNSAVQRLSEARMGERIELSARGERITVLEPAAVPTQPSGPNRLKIAGMGIFVGLSLAGGLFLLLEILNQSIRRPSEIESSLEITPLVTIPSFESASHRYWRRVALLGSTAVVVVLVPVALWAIDTHYMPLDVLFAKLKNKLL